MKKLRKAPSLAVWLLLSCFGCHSDGLGIKGTGGTGGGLTQGDAGLFTGGAPGTGGMQGTGGMAGSGGVSGSGGMVTTGGNQSSGGSLGSGGLIGTGGIVASGGMPGTGGLLGSGGKSGSGGVLGTGGRTGTGGGAGAAAGAGGGLGGTGGGAGAAAGAGGGLGGTGGDAGSGGTTATSCGGFIGAGCPAGQFCDYAVGTCSSIADAEGLCVAKGEGGCPAIYAPVCGCDGKTYPSDCDRLVAGVSKAASGACPSTSTACPSDISQINAWPCTEGLTCEYGSDPRPSCRSSATCSNGVWSSSYSRCSQLPTVTCPATREAASGQDCPTEGAYCVYSDLSCACNKCPTGTGPIICGAAPSWQCASPNPDPTCPPGVPLLGSACSTDGQTCSYACGSGGKRICKATAWYAADGGVCPQ